MWSYLLILLLWMFPQVNPVQQMESVKKKQVTQLTPLQRAVTQDGATEPPFSGEYYRHFEKGTYHCIVCGALLFTSEAKFDSPCGWPSFDAPAEKQYVLFLKDFSLSEMRIEVRCASCNAHLGHIFPDGPTQTGNRYCINSVALLFKKAE